MGYYIYAWLENGNPQLNIVDAETNSVCLSWGYQAQGEEPSNEQSGDKKEIQKLFRDLLLLTCKQEMRNCRVFEIKPITNGKTPSLQNEAICA